MHRKIVKKKMKIVHSEPLILKYRSVTYIFYYFMDPVYEYLYSGEVRKKSKVEIIFYSLKSV